MITKLTLKNFKSFGATGGEIPLGPLTLIVGTNASGKSNIRDALRFLHGIGRGYSLAEIIGGKYSEAGERIWDGIRGGMADLICQDATAREFTLGLEVVGKYSFPSVSDPRRVRVIRFSGFTYEITVSIRRSPSGFRAYVKSEHLEEKGGGVVFSSRPEILRLKEDFRPGIVSARVRKPDSKKYIGPKIGFASDRAILSQVGEQPDTHIDARAACGALRKFLRSHRFFDLDPGVLRLPSLPGQTVFGDKGHNLSSILRDIFSDSNQKAIFLEWLRELTPLDLADLEFPVVTPEGKIQLALKDERGRLISGSSASDGTLRFLAFLAATHAGVPPSMLFLEEIENGIHPNRLHLLLEVLQQATKSMQVIATTHSPALLNSLRGKTVDDALLTVRADRGTVVRRFGDMPMQHRDRIRTGELLGSGWFETTSAFLEADEVEEGGGR